MDITINIDLNGIISVIIAKVLKYKNIQLSEEEINKMIDTLLSDKEFINKLNSLIKI